MKQRRPSDIPPYRAGGRERLERLADFVRCLPPERLTFLHWHDRGRGCAVGLAAVGEPWFMAQGLRLEGADSLKDCCPTYEGVKDWPAVARFFEIGLADARELFDRGGYGGDLQPGPERVEAKIRAYLAKTAVDAVDG